MTRPVARFRALSLMSVLGLGTASLAGCANLPFLSGGGGGAVDFENVQSATIQIEAQGTFTPPGEGSGYETAGRGSGFLISKDGLAVTNNHVVVGAGVLEVWVGGDTSKTLNARVLGASECLDLALIDVDGGENMPYFAWESEPPKTAQEVYAAGFPLGDPEFTMTKGIVSKTEASGETDWASLDSVIEHDARIRGGNSGGPLVTPEGRVLGVNYAGDDVNDINLAIPANTVQEILPELREGDSPLSLGVNAQALPPTDEGTAQGIWVNSVASGSAADTLGLLPGDVLLTMEGVTLAAEGTLSEYCDVLRTKGTDAAIAVDVYRPTEGAYYTGQFNGDRLEAYTVPGSSEDEEPTTSTEEFTTVESDSGVVSVDVPQRWTDVDGRPFTDELGVEWDGVSASSDLTAYYDTWETGGVDVFASQAAVGQYTPEDLLDDFSSSAPEDCSLNNSDEYTDPIYTGVFNYYTDCEGTASSFVVVAATDESNSHMIVLAAVLATPEDEAALQTMLDTFFAAY